MPQPMHRADARKVWIGVIALVVAGIVVWAGVRVQAGGGLPARSYTYVSAEFNNVGMLKPRENVSERGKLIGSVTSIDYRSGHAVVTMRLDGEKPIYGDARATIINESALGRKQVSLNPGTPTAGRLGNRPIPATHTSDSVSVDDVFTVFDKPTREGLSTSLRELGGGFFGHSADMHDFVHTAAPSLNGLREISSTLVEPNTRLPDLLRSGNELSGRFQGREQEITNLLSDLDTTFRAVNADGGRPLSNTLQDLPITLRQARHDLSSLNAPLSEVESAMTTLRGGAKALGASTGDLRGFLREAKGPLRKVPGVSAQASPAVNDLTHTFSDARPLVPRLARTFASADLLLAGLSPYAPDLGRLVSEHDLLSGHFSPEQHYFSAMLAFPGPYNASLPDPTAKRVPYPEPGFGAWQGQPGSGGK